MISDNNPLCCCEYFDLHKERNHILACCCNCQDFDEGFDSFVSGRPISRHNQAGFMATLYDRLRIPWKGGARRISMEACISIVLVPIFLLIASISPGWTIISASTMILFLTYVKCRISKSNPRMKFFFAWMNTSFVVVYLIFEFVVIPFLQILWEENIALSVLIAIAYFCFWKTKTRRSPDGLTKNCVYCMTQVPSDSRHYSWLDCCVGQHNAKQYTIGLCVTIAALLYGCNLTLTTVCHPFEWFAIILLPDDCTEAYDLFELSLSFVSGLYTLGIATYLSILLIHRITLIMFYTLFSQSQHNRKTQDNFIA
ncbi:zinc finger dhhc domain containing protein [Holotrichia oblita]|uniref:Zinc finger dhhc domain containing protein n=3 Tax=Holotrichia oblita TaxID=644536 RepID=A0ACB9T171_HOLOL|nr:zinc finger dhhc domain containing protein [Holotrichia oblita]KAI4460552.1 zinc finger dhhc domain containing protein [Holotrichia oblita]KAI4460573.1 zinc finger dhhc domain containing protein [Holotrichia oblita]